VIELQHLSKSFGGAKHQPVKALNDLSLQVPEGMLYGILGPNGSGKTTCIRILCTLLSPDSGTVTVSGIDAISNPRQVRRLLGYVAQDVAIDKILTGRELLTFQSDLYHLQGNLRNKRISELIDLLDMGEWIDRRCGSYSGGMRRRIDLAAGLLHSPQLLVLDEPTVGLDIESRAVVWQVLRQLRDQGVTIVLSSHYLEEIDALSDRLAILDSGSVIAEGTPSELKQALGGERISLKVREFSDIKESEKLRSLLLCFPGVRDVVINQSQGYSLNLLVDSQDVCETVRNHLLEQNVPLFSLTQSRPSLDDVYLQATGRTLLDAELAVAGMRDPKAERKQSM
jgi:ABC-2 type transport system ATP-binding protein